MEKNKKYKPLILTGILIILDQVTKYLVVKNIPQNTIGYEFFGDFLKIIHVRNLGIAFSIGYGFSDFLRIVLFIVLPIIVMLFIFKLIVSEKQQFLLCQRWFLAGILGGGIGTIIDRIFRFNTGVVDFISVKFYGLLGFERWPTFNISDSCVVIFVFLLAFSVLFSKNRKDQNVKKNNDSN